MNTVSELFNVFKFLVPVSKQPEFLLSAFVHVWFRVCACFLAICTSKSIKFYKSPFVKLYLGEKIFTFKSP